MTSEEHQKIAVRARRMRCHIVRMLAASASGHPGGSLSATDVLAVLYSRHMHVRSDEPNWADRDRFVLSKGHAAPALYAILSEMGFIPEEELLTLRQLGSRLQGHPDCKKTPGVDMSTGSLGQGLSAANGMALGLKLDKRDARVYVLLGDGEMEEGQVWEAAMTAAHYRLDNLTAVLDNNGLQIDGDVRSVKSMVDPGRRFESFGWNVLYIDGHNLSQIDSAIELAKETKGVPTIIVAKTVKGKGVSFMENQVGWHGAAPKPEDAEKALAELKASGRCE